VATSSVLAQTTAVNHMLTGAALRATKSTDFDVIHAHDWLVAHTAVTLREHLGIPLIATIHATEAGRHQGWLPDETSRGIHSVEWWLSKAAVRIVVCSAYMKWEVGRLFGLPPDKISVIPNGVQSAEWEAPPHAVAAARARYAGAGPLIGFAGRLVHEKGVQDVLRAMPALCREHPGLRLVIAGNGPCLKEHQEQAHRMGLRRAVSFAGFMTEQDLAAMFAAADAAVVPSLYEPFGLVALEAAAAGVPLAVAATGGLAEIIQPGITGRTFACGDPDSLAGAVSALLTDEPQARRLAAEAKRMVRDRYSWDVIADRSAATYAAAGRQAPAALDGHDHPTMVVPEGNLLIGASP
jgi:glycogen(starch) synthase